MPKAIVSGDFYWCYSNKQYDFIAVADCTGHGVPGALMSIIASQTLDKVVKTHGFTEPKEILFHLDDMMMTSLKQSTGKIQDGMDIAFCCVDKKNKTVVFAGAQRPLFFYDGKNLTEVPGTKQGIGGNLSGTKFKKFTQTELNYKSGDRMYLTSDGYYSQFGGDKGKKMMKKQLIQFLSEISAIDFEEQKNQLIEFYNKWQGLEEQVDDVLVVGVEL